MLLEGKTAVVTAAGQGIGRACAEALHAAGAEVHASDLRADLLGDFPGASSAGLDVTFAAAVDAYFGRFTRVDILVHAAGWVHQGTVTETTDDEWRKSMAVTLDSAFHVIRAGVPKMARPGGSIVTIASVASSIRGFARRAAYGAAKGGVLGLTKAVAADCLKDGIRANAVCPGTVDSPSLRTRVEELAATMNSREAAWKVFLDRQPSGRLGTPEEIAALVVFLASDAASFMTGQAIAVDGGITI
jgi:2-keto-3-deoxy-L-fuconate dehydrogenase